MDKSYEEELKDVRWLKRRVDILIKRHFKCELCGGTYNLQIHHKKYRKSLRPWEYNDNELLCLCGNCHELQHNKRELNLKGDFLLLPLGYDDETGAFFLPWVDDIFLSKNIFPEQHAYMMVSKRGEIENLITQQVNAKNIARICISKTDGIWYIIYPKSFYADKLGGFHGKETSLMYVWDNDDYDPSYVEFTKLPPFEYDLAVICVDEEGVSGWHKGMADILFNNLHLL